MFKKTTPRAATATTGPHSDLPPSNRPALDRTPGPPASSRGFSTLSSDLRLDGIVSGAGELQIDGEIKGDVRVGRLIVGETGSIDGNVTTEYLEVRGRILGTIIGKQVKLTATGYVEGDITAEQLSIDAGAYFQGRVLKATPVPASPS